MAIPKVFISSTCYDLKYIRENLKYFISNMGYESILSEYGDVYYNPDLHTHDACLTEVCNSQLFVLIIGGRNGGQYKEGEKSITNMEYEEAVRSKIPVFTLIERNVLSEHLVYQKNKSNANVKEIIYPSIDNIKIFEFIDNVRKNGLNNAYFPFSDFKDIESYLKKQWAGLMFDFLTNSIETKKVETLFEELHTATDKIEYYTKNLLIQGHPQNEILIKIYELIIDKDIVQNLARWQIKVTPKLIIKNDSIDQICNDNIVIEEADDGAISITHGGPPYKCTIGMYEDMSNSYEKLRNEILKVLEGEELSVEKFLKEFE